MKTTSATFAYLSAVAVLLVPSISKAQRAPEAGYIFPAGGKAGTTVEVKLGGYNWTPDMEYFVSEPRIRLVPDGPPGPILIPEPPYWFGAKGRIAAPPLAKEVSAKLVIPAELPPGPIYWQAANANGATSPIAFLVAGQSDVIEDDSNVTRLPALNEAIAISGRLLKNEEVDRYRFIAAKDGPVTCDLHARRLGSKFLGILEVRDDKGRMVADDLGSHGADPVLTFAAKAGREYVVGVRDIDFAGDRSFVYRLLLAPGPRIVGALPAAGRRGETREVEFIGFGVATGSDTLESVKRTVAFPANGSLLEYRLETAWGQSPPFPLLLSDVAEAVAPRPFVQRAPLSTPGAVTGILDRDAEDRYACNWQKGELWTIHLDARRIGSPLDVSLAIVGADGKELARAEERTTTTDASLEFTVPADGAYQIAVSDTAAKNGSRTAFYRLEVVQAAPDFALQLASPRVNVPLGGKTDLAVKAIRRGGFKGPISVTLRGLPEGIAAPADLAIPEGKSDLIVPLKASADAGSVAGFVSAAGMAMIDGKSLTRSARASSAVHLITRDPDENLIPSLVVAATMKPRFKGHPVDKDTGRKVPRGSTFPAEVVVQRLDGFKGEITLQMAAQQSYQVQGITGGDVRVPPGVERAVYPCYMPEWLESTRTSRMGIIAVAKVADSKGKERYLVSDIAGFVTMTMEGALLKVSSDDAELTVPQGQPFDVRVKLARVANLTEQVRIELVVPKELTGQLKAEVATANIGQDSATLRVIPSSGLSGVRTMSIRATALQDGKYPVVSETPVVVEFVPAVSSRRNP